jgi:prepilin-type N-terminal cleavage/methylation domain-containing protein
VRPMYRTLHRFARTRRSLDPAGFTLVELMITLLVLAAVVVVLSTVMFAASRAKVSSSNSVESSQAARIAMDMIARDLRSAGYGADRDYIAQPQNPIAYIDSLQVLINEDVNPYPDTLSAGKGIPLAYNPSGTGTPFPFNGTSWAPPIRYRTGAETVRWTLDLNNDGLVNASDQADPNAVDARRTVNPDDFELVRQVYGDSTNGTSGNNGPTTERVALVLKPGGSVAPMFKVYMAGSSTPWDWSSGPVPAAQLPNISRITVQVTAASGKADWKGRYAQSVYTSDVSSMRNVPSFGVSEYPVDGYVFNDLNGNHIKDAGEPGLAGATVKLGNLSTVTGASGYYLIQAAAGTYTERHIPPTGYGVAMNPDSFLVMLSSVGVSHNFADSVRTGGTVTAYVYNDLNNNGTQDAGEPAVNNCKVQITPNTQTGYTNSSGVVSFFTPVGSYTVTCTAPDSFVVTTTNPITASMSNGGSITYNFGVYKAPQAIIKGTVYRDANNDGTKQNSEAGIPNVWVGVTTDGGYTIAGYAYTDASGNYSIAVAANDPPKTTPYQIMVIPPAGYYPTTTTSINGIYLKGGNTLSGQNFGMNSFQVISLSASHVLCLGSADLVEKDWNGTHTDRRNGDADIVLGSDAAGTDQVSVWFNQYSSTPIFNASPDYTRPAPNSVMSLALDTLETNWARRRDLVTGTVAAAAGNFFVWLTQDSPNYGYFPNSYSTAYKTLDNGDVQSVLTYDCAGGLTADAPDIIVGTKGPTAGTGSIEVWRNNNASPTPAFTRDDVYPGISGMAVGTLGEVTCMALADIDGDGKKDLIVGTRTSNYSGQVSFFKFTSKTLSPHFVWMGTMNFPNDVITALVPVDVDRDGNMDVVVGTQNGLSSGALYWLRNLIPGTFTFSYQRRVDAPGIVSNMVTADFGGGIGADIAIGYRTVMGGYTGGVRIYYLDGLTLPNGNVDPSAGAVTNWVPALNTNNFNYGIYPSAPAPPYLSDLAAGVKVTNTTGALVLFIR